MQEIPQLMEDHEFQKELERIQEHLNAISKDSNTVEVRRNYLISYVTWETKEEHPYKPASLGRSEN